MCSSNPILFNGPEAREQLKLYFRYTYIRKNTIYIGFSTTYIQFQASPIGKGTTVCSSGKDVLISPSKLFFCTDCLKKPNSPGTAETDVNVSRFSPTGKGAMWAEQEEIHSDSKNVERKL